jgi:2-iminobutanoate/2-iminopropanoate deaminase
MTIIKTDHAPRAVGAYSQGVLVGNTLYVSGQIPFDPISMTVVEGGVREQTDQALKNLFAVVEAAGMTKENIVRCGVFMTDLGLFQDMNEVYEKRFEGHKPARAAVGVVALPKGVMVEIDAIAVK